MKLRDIYPGSYAVLRSGMVVAVVSHQKPTSKCIDGSGTIDMLNDVEARPLTKEDSVKVGDCGSLWVKNPEPAKVVSVPLETMNVGQYGINCHDEIICRTNESMTSYGFRFVNLNTGDCFDGGSELARIFPVGSKLDWIDGKPVVEEPEVNGLEWDDLEAGDYFTDREGDLGVKIDREKSVYLAWPMKPSEKAGVLIGNGKCFKPLTRKTPAEAAAIIAGQ